MEKDVKYIADEMRISRRSACPICKQYMDASWHKNFSSKRSDEEDKRGFGVMSRAGFIHGDEDQMLPPMS